MAAGSVPRFESGRSKDVNRLFHGLGTSLENLHRLSEATSRSISAENRTGGKGCAGQAVPAPDSPASELGAGWKVSPCLTVKANQTVTLAEIDGPGAIQSIWFGGVITSDFVLRMYWDGQENPSVEAPLGAFFAYGFGDGSVNHFDGRFPVLHSLPVVVAPHRGLSCYWLMPFRRHCTITLENQGLKDSYTFFQINYTLTDVPEDSAYFHASYRQAMPVQNGLYTVIDGIRGKGHYVGTALFANLQNDVDCWVEGEAHFFLDGDRAHPTIAYTGTEDYFCGSYNFGHDRTGKYNTYSAPYVGMYYVHDSKTGGDVDCEKLMAYRWHIPDPVRFDEEIRLVLQNIRYRERKFVFRSDCYASVAYWYQRLPTAPFQPLAPAEDRSAFQRSTRV